MTQEEAVVRLGIDSSGIEQQAGQAKGKLGGFAEQWGEHMGRKINRVMFHLMGIELISEIKKKFEELVGWIAEKLGEISVDPSGTEKGWGQVYEANRQALRKMVKERDEDRIKEAKALEERQKKAREVLKAEEESVEAASKLWEEQHGGEKSMTVLRQREKELGYSKALADTELAQARHAGDKLAISKAETELAKVRLSILQNQERMDVLKIARLKPQADRARAALADPRNAAEIAQITALEQDAMESQRFNPRRAAVDRKMAQDLARDLLSRSLGASTQQKTLADTIMDKLGGMIDRDVGIPVKITNADDQ